MRVAVGISGGVDSAVAALLLKERGCDVFGVTMTLGRNGEESSVAAARAVAARLGIPLEVVDLSEPWHAQVCAYVRDTYLRGQTPNPCVRCNERVKFGLLPRFCFDNFGCDRFATGHYARVKLGTGPDDTGEKAHFRAENVHLLRGVDRKKDQSYFLYRVARDVLARTIFPLGEMTKTEVRTLAREMGLPGGDSPDSQDFCGGDPMAIVGASDRPGDVVTEDGRVLGRHRGYWHYTVGMRKGLGIGGGGTPWYVLRLDAAANRVVVGPRAAAVSHALTLADRVGEVDVSLPVKVRSAGEPRLLSEGIVGVAPGQSAVFYRGDEVVGGGIIAAGDGP